MERDILQKVEATFGFQGWPKPLFYSSEIALRFSLSDIDAYEEDRYLDRFLDSFSNAYDIVKQCFESSQAIVATFIIYGSKKPFPDSYAGLAGLESIGFRKFEIEHIGSIKRNDEDDPKHDHMHLFASAIGHDFGEIRKLIWSSVAEDMGIKPKAYVDVYLVDFERGIAANVYDDRGLDILATDREAIQGLYDKFKHLLLDYDRAQMDKVFADKTP